MKNIIKKIPNLRHLRAFMVVVECESITSASNFLHVSQPAISKAISNMEALAGTMLFSRSPEGTYATDEGRFLYSKVKHAFEHLDNGFKDVLGDIHRVKRLLHITTSNQLKAFMTVARVTSFSEAAAILGVPASAIHRSVREFEENLELTLFQRKGKVIESTPAAEQLNLSVTSAVREIIEGLGKICPKSSVDGVNLSIGCVADADNSTLFHHISEFASQASNCRVSIEDGTVREQLQRLRAGEVDVVIGHADSEESLSGIVSKKSRFSDPLVVAVSATHTLAAADHISDETLASFPWVVSSNYAINNRNTSELWKEIGSMPEKTIEANSIDLALKLVDGSNSLGVFLLSQVKGLFELGRLKLLSIDLEQHSYSESVFVRSGWQPTAMQKSFVESISQ